jgi:hypothetical protein
MDSPEVLVMKDDFRGLTRVKTDDRGGALTGKAGRVVTLYSFRQRQDPARDAARGQCIFRYTSRRDVR